MANYNGKVSDLFYFQFWIQSGDGSMPRLFFFVQAVLVVFYRMLDKYLGMNLIDFYIYICKTDFHTFIDIMCLYG